jgi:hypothetical protein
MDLAKSRPPILKQMNTTEQIKQIITIMIILCPSFVWKYPFGRLSAQRRSNVPAIGAPQFSRIRNNPTRIGPKNSMLLVYGINISPICINQSLILVSPYEK